MSEKTITRSYGVSGLFLLGLLFLGLKLTDHIDWSWWIVLLPFYLPWAIVIGLMVFALLVAAIITIFER